MQSQIKTLVPMMIRNGRSAPMGSVTGAIVVTLVMLLMPLASSGAASPHGSAGLSWSSSWGDSMVGCSVAKGVKYKLYTITGQPTTKLAKGAGLTSAKTCGPANGGPNVSSTASIYNAITLQVPLQLKASKHGVNVTWSLNGSAFSGSERTRARIVY